MKSISHATPAKWPGLSAGNSRVRQTIRERSGTNMEVSKLADHTVKQRYRVVRVTTNIALVAMVKSTKENSPSGLVPRLKRKRARGSTGLAFICTIKPLYITMYNVQPGFLISL